MVKLLVHFKYPQDPLEFMRRFETGYWPLVLKLPGLTRAEANKVQADNFGGTPTYLLIVELQFPNKEIFKAAMESQANMLAGRELLSFARGYFTLMVADVVTETSLEIKTEAQLV